MLLREGSIPTSFCVASPSILESFSEKGICIRSGVCPCDRASAILGRVLRKPTWAAWCGLRAVGRLLCAGIGGLLRRLAVAGDLRFHRRWRFATCIHHLNTCQPVSQNDEEETIMKTRAA